VRLKKEQIETSDEAISIRVSCIVS